jgi:hypothetical protein
MVLDLEIQTSQWRRHDLWLTMITITMVIATLMLMCMVGLAVMCRRKYQIHLQRTQNGSFRLSCIKKKNAGPTIERKHDSDQQNELDHASVSDMIPSVDTIEYVTTLGAEAMTEQRRGSGHRKMTGMRSPMMHTSRLDCAHIAFPTPLPPPCADSDRMNPRLNNLELEMHDINKRMHDVNGEMEPRKLSDREIRKIFPHFHPENSDSGRDSDTPSLERIEGFENEKYATILPQNRRFPPATH